jgi:transcriptional regulator with XRE-family HTH domain
MVKRNRHADFYKQMGERLRIAREISGLTQSEIAKELGLTRTSVVNIESGNQSIPLHTFVTLCDLLKVSFNLVLTGRSRGKS